MLFHVLLLLSPLPLSLSFSFLTVGDWGGAALGGQAETNVYSVSSQMAETASSSGASFVVNVGDNFYWCGIQNTSDYQIEVDYVKPYSEESLQIPWYSVLGNHEYGYNVTAQVEYSTMNENWIMDARYYTRRVLIDPDSSTYISFIFLDTSPCISDYRSDNPEYWDPCGSDYPTCSLDSSDDDFEGECMFHENIISQDCTEQYNWLQKALAAVPEADWLIIVGHHPADEIDVQDFTSLIQAHGFDLYLNGHAHTLTHYTVDNSGAYVTSGAGALVSTSDQVRDRMARKVAGDKEILGHISPASSHSYQTLWNSKTAGFTLHTFDESFENLVTDFISYDGTIIHSFTVSHSSG
mmetsp:Transcript_8470/g.12634  ORF Transcript_8470/g.12634 Transcript_8470/m.12634 type:complete len:352 (-) Transcript_8470:206-1261(-)